MRLFSTLSILLVAIPLFAAEPAKKELFNKEQLTKVVENMPRVTMEDVGIIKTPLPNIKAFDLPRRWQPVKMINDASVYIVKDARRFLHPATIDASRTDYILWGDLRGIGPEIVVWNCLDKNGRAAKIASLEKADQDRKTALALRRKNVVENRIRRKRERQLRVNARQQERARVIGRAGRKLAASQERHQQLLGMQQPLADAVLDRVTNALATGKGQVSSFSMDKKSRTDVRQNIIAVMALQLQMRDIQWCDAIQKHLAPNMWNSRSVSGHDVLKNSDPETVITWLYREIERQTERAESRVNYEQDAVAEENIRRAEQDVPK